MLQKHTTLIYGPPTASEAMKARADKIRSGRGNGYIRDPMYYTPQDHEDADVVEIWGDWPLVKAAYQTTDAKVVQVKLDDEQRFPTNQKAATVKLVRSDAGHEKWDVIHSLTGLPVNKIPLSKPEARFLASQHEDDDEDDGEIPEGAQSQSPTTVDGIEKSKDANDTRPVGEPLGGEQPKPSAPVEHLGNFDAQPGMHPPPAHAETKRTADGADAGLVNPDTGKPIENQPPLSAAEKISGGMPVRPPVEQRPETQTAQGTSAPAKTKAQEKADAKQAKAEAAKHNAKILDPIPNLSRRMAKEGAGKFDVYRDDSDVKLNHEPMSQKESTAFMKNYDAFLRGNRENPPEG